MRGYERRNMDDPITLDTIKTIEWFKQIEVNHPNYLEDYNQIKANHSKRIITASKNGATFGMFMPETTLLYWNEHDKITKNEDKKEFAFYFDSEDRLIMTEKFAYDLGRLHTIYLYYYYTDHADIISYNAKDLNIEYLKRIEYKDGKAIKFSNFRSISGYVDILVTDYLYDDKIIENTKYLYEDRLEELTRTFPKTLEENNTNHKEKKETKKSNMKSDIKNEIKKLILKSINEVQDEDIYAFSLYVEDDGDETKPTVTFGYNTLRQYEDSIESAEDKAEAKWNYAFWLQNELFVYGRDESAQVVENWIDKKNLLEDDDDYEDETPKITKEFVKELIKVVKELHKEKVLTEKFGKELPIIIHELEYYEEIGDQNIKANGKKLLGDFLEFCPCDTDNDRFDSNNATVESCKAALDSISTLPEDMKADITNIIMSGNTSDQKFFENTLLEIAKKYKKHK